jgi:hypothetical protein
VVLIDGIAMGLSIKPEDAVDWLKNNSNETIDKNGVVMYQVMGGDTKATPQNFHSLISTRSIGPIIEWFIRNLDASQRSSVATSQAGSGSLRNQSSSLHRLFRDGDLEEQLSLLCEKAFGFPLTLDRVNGSVMLRVGKPTLQSPLLQHPTIEYSNEVLDLPPLSEQGDGVKNYLGMVLHMMTGMESVTIFDEPEAFLHPAQARALGRHLGREVSRRSRQLITATHDRDFVLGLLGSGCPLTILRIDRVGNTNTFTSIDSSTIANIWSKPALRYSNLLQGLFHRTVVLCEGDADCQWYAAVADTIGDEQQIGTEEVLFVPGGGKDQLPASLTALTGLDISAFTITDFDSIYSENYIRVLLKAKGIQDDDLIAKAKSLHKLLVNDGRIQAAKDSGFAGVPSGSANTMAVSIVSRLREYKILIVPTGELESFDRTIGGHGPSWVSAALNRGSHQTSIEAKELVDPIVRSLSAVDGNMPNVVA